MSRTTEQKLRQQRERALQKAEQARREDGRQAVALHLAQNIARAASPNNVLAEKAGEWNQYMHLPPVWFELSRKQLYEITADDVARLLVDTIRAGGFDRLDETEPLTALQSVARKALPFAARFEHTWRQYWWQQS